MCFFFRGTILLRMICISALAKSFRFKRTINHAKHNCVWGMWNGLPHCRHRQIHRYQNTHTHTQSLLLHAHALRHIHCPFVWFHVPQLSAVTQPISCRCHRTCSHKSPTHMFPLTVHTRARNTPHGTHSTLTGLKSTKNLNWPFDYLLHVSGLTVNG